VLHDIFIVDVALKRRNSIMIVRRKNISGFDHRDSRFFATNRAWRCQLAIKNLTPGRSRLSRVIEFQRNIPTCPALIKCQSLVGSRWCTESAYVDHLREQRLCHKCAVNFLYLFVQTWFFCRNNRTRLFNMNIWQLQFLVIWMLNYRLPQSWSRVVTQAYWW